MAKSTFTLELCGLTRVLPIVSLGPKLKVASFNLLGDGELVEKTAQALAKKLAKFDFEVLVGPEVKVVPLLQTLSQILNKPRYVVCRKKIHGYMTNPLTLGNNFSLILNGPDAEFLQGKKVAIIDDVVSTGRTFQALEGLIKQSGGEVAVNAVILKQGESPIEIKKKFLYLGKLPLFTKSP